MVGLDALTQAIYHEKQQPGVMLCAQHALNAILQGSYFTAPDLSVIARQLDEEELVHNPERGQTSENMDDTGFFSSQVVTRALDPFGLTLVPWRSESLRSEHSKPQEQHAFVLNHDLHWFTLRRFGTSAKGQGHWYNLNSMLPAPEWLSDTYIGMFIQQAEEEGYSVFAVRAADETPHFQLPRTEADELAATLPAPSGASRTASRFGMQLGSLGASSGVSTPGLLSGARTPSSVIANAGPDAAPLGETNADWMADEDMELQAALQASMMSGAGGGFDPAWLDEGSASTGPTAGPAHVPEALTPPAAPRLLSAQLDQDQTDAHLPPTRNRYAAPGAFPIQEDDDEPENEVGNETFQEIFTAEREARELEAAGDAVGAGMARSRATLARFQREQTAAARAMDRFRELREANETPAAKEARERRQREAEEEDEHMKRAIEESMRMAKDMPMEGVEGQTPLATPTATGSGAGASGPLAHLRTFDDEDAELQAALKASMESAGAHSASSLMPETHPRQRLERGGSHTSVKTQDTYTTESDAGAEDAKMEEAALPPQETMEEIRKKRLARFGA